MGSRNIRESHNRYPVVGLIISLILEHVRNIVHSLLGAIVHSRASVD